MKLVSAALAAITGLSLGMFQANAAHASPAQSVIGKFASAWAGVRTYECTLASHEVEGTAVQDRVYQFYFSKPFNTRAEIIAGDGRGSVGVWRGGNTVRGHKGGILKGILLNLDLHSSLATTLRGTTFAQANMGALLGHLEHLPSHTLRVGSRGDEKVLTILATHPADSDGITKEIYYFQPDGLPARYEEYEGATLVKRVIYSDLKLNPNLSPSTFNL